jgi:hypothetical protein
VVANANAATNAKLRASVGIRMAGGGLQTQTSFGRGVYSRILAVSVPNSTPHIA